MTNDKPPAAEQVEFNRRMGLIVEALEGADDFEEGMSWGLLSTACADWLAQYDAETRHVARKDLIDLIDDMTADNIIAGCDA